MAIIPLVRTIVFALVPLFSLVVLGISVYLEYINALGPVLPAILGSASACVTIVTLPLFSLLGRARRGVFTSMIIFEIVWFLVLWLAWVATAGVTAVVRASGSCGDPFLTQTCYDFSVLEAFAFLNFFIVFFYYDVLVLYATISAIRGRGIWTMSVRDAASGGPYNPAVAMTQPQYPPQLAPQYPQYPGFQNVPSAAGYPSTVAQPYNAYPQQTILLVGPGQPYLGTPQQQYPGIPQQQYPGMPQQQQHPGAPQQQYLGAPQQQYPGIPQQQYPGAPQQQYPGVPQLDNSNSVQNGYTSNLLSMGNSPLPPQPDHNSFPKSYLPQGQA
ncbi:hypothetical protein EDD16DRAFT_1703852 [Pisolithus croceorrhizus]|nr:hypothetical protein EV401DRAFT_2070402 [Pisolithus croceorrhizus]KAI6124175.1 hypothetical protein EDD16DRAFT_1703852 [Pisolithus croceorrhizus]KAI6159963.1 hypothetical protein EDD17DRAFT_871221 [Pisolithus thermaeus]